MKLSLNLFSRTFRQMQQNIWLECISVLTLIFCLLVMGMIHLFYVSINDHILRISSGSGLRLILVDGLPSAQGQELARNISLWPQMQRADYVSPEQGLGRLRNHLGEQNQLLAGLNYNPLPAVIEIRLKSEYHDVFSIKEQLTNLSEVAEVIEARPWLERLEQANRLFQQALIVIAVILFLAMAFVVGNTVRLSVYARSHQLEIQDLLGATRSYIRAPFVLETLIQALIAVLISCLLLWLGLLIIPYLPGIPLWIKSAIPFSLPWPTVIVLLTLAVPASILGAWFGVNRILRNEFTL